jgi:hypothetical protein
MDLPIEEVMRRAKVFVRENVNVFMQYTCSNCQERATAIVANVFPGKGRCPFCQQETIIKQCNYVVEGSTQHKRAIEKLLQVTDPKTPPR